jgi:hypothetical protein
MNDKSEPLEKRWAHTKAEDERRESITRHAGDVPLVPAMTPDEARATLCRSVAAQLEESVRRAEADLDARQAAPGFEPTPETNNIALVTLATLELRDSLLVSAKQFDKSSRPRILRPERSVRIVR